MSRSTRQGDHIGQPVHLKRERATRVGGPDTALWRRVLGAGKDTNCPLLLLPHAHSVRSLASARVWAYPLARLCGGGAGTMTE